MNLHTIREITYGTIFFRLFLSIVIGGVLGLERGRKSRPAGLRTYILVCLGSTVVMMTNQYVSQCMNTGDPVRMGAQVLSGIGFIGAGSIMKTGRNQVRGRLVGSSLHRSGYWHRFLRSCHCRRHPDFHCVVAHAEHGLLYTEAYECH